MATFKLFATVAVLCVLEAIPVQPKPHAGSSIEYFSFAGAPYINIHSSKLSFQGHRGHCREGASEYAAHLKNAYSKALEIRDEQQAKLEAYNELNQEILLQEELANQLKQIKQERGSQNVALSKQLENQESKLQELKKQQSEIAQSLSILDASKLNAENKVTEPLIKRTDNIDELVKVPEVINEGKDEQEAPSNQNPKPAESKPEESGNRGGRKNSKKAKN